MDSFEPAILLSILALIVLAAALYSSVGHGGASGYLAVMALFGMAPAFMKPAALSMNVAVAGYVFFRLWRAGHFNGRLFAPFAVASIPLAWLGGSLTLHDAWYQWLVGGALLFAALRLFGETRDTRVRARPNAWLAVAIGALLGLLSGLTGVGGGIFLSPVLLLLRWTTMRQNAAMAAAFILVNSLAALAGHVGAGKAWPPDVPYYIIAAMVGGLIGAELAVRRLAPVTLKKLLGVVLVIAGLKMILTA